MVLLRCKPYFGTKHVRDVRKSDFERGGVTDQDYVAWTPDNKHTAEVSKAAADHLIDIEPQDWAIVESIDDVTDSGSGIAAQKREDSAETAGTQSSGATSRKRS